LALPRSKKIELNLVGLNLNIANSSLSIDNYKRYWTESGHGGAWSEGEIDEILNLIPSDGLDIAGDVNANALGLAVAHFGLSFQAIGKALGVIPKEPVELFLKGNLRDNYLFNALDGEGFSAVKISIAGSHPLKVKKYFESLAVGMNFNYYRGLAVFEVLESDGFFHTASDYIHAKMNVTGRKGEGGIGYGFDLGVGGSINKQWSVSLAIKNVFADITWHTNTEEIVYSFELDSSQYAQKDDADTEATDTTYAIDQFRTSLPTVFHIGFAYQLSPKLLLSLDLEQASHNKLGYSDQGLLAIGAQYSPLSFLPLRGGMSFGGKWGYKFGLGFGLHFGVFHFDIAYSMHRALWPTVSRGFSTAVNLKFLI
jgi:hypothetical protein